MPIEPDNAEPLIVAAALANASPQDAFKIFEQLREQHRLSATVRGLNVLLHDAQHREVAIAALRRLGLEYGG